MIRLLAFAAALAVLPAAPAPALALAQTPDPVAAEDTLETRIEQAVELSLDDEDLDAITDAATAFALNLVQAIDLEALTQQAVTGGLAVVNGVATHGSWSNPDPDQLVTYGLMADYALHTAAEDAGDE